MEQKKPKVAFICNHNSCRSQMAEAMGKLLASDVFESYSAGTIIKNQINQDAVRVMKNLYDIDMEATQFNKKLEDIPQPDVSIFMGCNVSCPFLVCDYSENWGLDDPSGRDDAFFGYTVGVIHEKMLQLKEKLSQE
ncbi:arsenate reductase ArsC [Bengtsoniella intestinalis]|uniref:arsenate reductase/protein-tyrosine-phosphatase family protein n=1 Tax=Bengtsoniella intestinalis TaxID=3073143 RepID=UPI00391F36B0